MNNYDVCIIGSGPAGLLLAMELSQHKVSVLIIESGSKNFDSEIQSLSNATIENDQSHVPMSDAIQRRLGGTSNIWGGRCVPFDSIDFQDRSYVNHSGWPLTENDFSEHYTKASEYLGIDQPNFSPTTLNEKKSKTLLAEGLSDSDVINVSHHERWSTQPKLWQTYKLVLKNRKNLTILENTTCIGFTQKACNTNVSDIHIKSTLAHDDKTTTIKAKIAVIACGGVESTRLILNSIQKPDGLKLTGSKNVGLFYMGHLSGKIADIQFNGNPQKTIYGFEQDGKVYVRKRIKFKDIFLENNKLLNIAFWLDNPTISDPSHKSGILSAAYLGLNTPLVKHYLTPTAIRKKLLMGDEAKNYIQHFYNFLLQPINTTKLMTRYLFLKFIAKPPIPGFFTYADNNKYSLHFHSEQTPNKNSKITLNNNTDPLGLKRVNINLVWSDQDIKSVINAHKALDKHLKDTGIGKLVYKHSDKEMFEAIKNQSSDGIHQLGTLRMSSTPENGVTNEYGLLFGTKNLYVSSSALFPTSGQANPTFSIVANALRQSKHILNTLKKL